ncbi:MAG: hypothetical protein SFW36_11805 [Leptolyngbyaceae cyanobacterium bins.59]|nr:hypothetical protein [Leptolyngbyaceae cyanobacterium bins.59]
MQPPQQPPPPSSDPGKDFNLDRDFEQALHETEQALQALRDRYRQIQHDWQQQGDLQQRLTALQQEWQQTRLPELKSELKRLQQQLDDLEMALESRLLTWLGVREIFWQVVRFGGMGVVIGWLLKSCAG